MTLLPGCRLGVASRFHLEADWPARVGLGAGVEAVDGRFFPRGPWRAPTAQDLAVLATDDARHVLELFQLPDHLRAAWWELLDETAGSGEPLRGFEEFAARVTEFLGFKRLDVPASARMEAIVTAAGERSIRRDADTGQPSGLGPTVAPWAPWPSVDDVAVPRLWGVVNLGDEDTGVVLVNLPLSGLAAELARRAPGNPVPATVGELVGRFLQAFPDYPPVRLRLGPGEGCRLPPHGLVLDGDPTGKEEPDLLLLISADGDASAVPGR